MTTLKEITENNHAQDYFDKISKFLRSIGIEISVGTIPEKTHLEDVYLHEGKIIIRNIKATTLGSALHDAGHIAIVPLQFRHLLTGNIGRNSIQQHYRNYMNATPFFNIFPALKGGDFRFLGEYALRRLPNRRLHARSVPPVEDIDCSVMIGVGAKTA